MKAIWKFPLTIMDTQTVEMPEGGQALYVQMQHGQPCLWALVDPSAPKVKQIIAIFGTGHPAPDTLDRHNYIGTFLLDNGSLVFHVFGWIN